LMDFDGTVSRSSCGRINWFGWQGHARLLVTRLERLKLPNPSHFALQAFCFCIVLINRDLRLVLFAEINPFGLVGFLCACVKQVSSKSINNTPGTAVYFHGDCLPRNDLVHHAYHISGGCELDGSRLLSACSKLRFILHHAFHTAEPSKVSKSIVS